MPGTEQNMENSSSKTWISGYSGIRSDCFAFGNDGRGFRRSQMSSAGYFWIHTCIISGWRRVAGLKKRDAELGKVGFSWHVGDSL